MELQPGKLVVFEAQGYCGKTKQADLLVARLTQHGINSVKAEHPGTVPVGIRNREYLNKMRGRLTADETLDLFYESLDAITRDFVIPHNTMGIWVVQTRHLPSMEVYQCRDMGANRQMFDQYKKAILALKVPDLQILLKVEPEEVTRRMLENQERGLHSHDVLHPEKTVKKYHDYLDAAKDMGLVVVDGYGSPEQVHEKVWTVLVSRLGLKDRVAQVAQTLSTPIFAT